MTVEYFVDGQKVASLDELFQIVGAQTQKQRDMALICLKKGKSYKKHRIQKVLKDPEIRCGALIRNHCTHRLG